MAPRALTALSHPVAPKGRRFPKLWPLAWLSLGSLLMVIPASGCVVADPPDYGRTDQTPPLLLLALANPNLHEVIPARSGDPLSVSVPVRSEDAGDPLVAQLFTNYKLAQQGLLQFREVDASTFADLEREIRITASVPSRRGCQQLSLVVTHKSNLDDANLPIRAADTAIATWWVNVDDQDDTNSLSACPKAAVQ
jgi:hypothetical protein